MNSTNIFKILTREEIDYIADCNTLLLKIEANTDDIYLFKLAADTFNLTNRYLIDRESFKDGLIGDLRDEVTLTYVEAEARIDNLVYFCNTGKFKNEN